MSEPLPSTPYCRVLPSEHEVHFWDKGASKAGRCLCRSALTVGKRVAPSPATCTEDSVAAALNVHFHGEGYTAAGHNAIPVHCAPCHEAAEVAVSYLRDLWFGDPT